MKHCGDTDPKHRPHLWGKAHGMHVCPGSSFLDAQDAAQRDETPSGGGTDGQDAPDASEARCRDCGRTAPYAHPSDCRVVALHDHAIEAADLAQTQGGQAGIASGLAAIALAILARTENPRD